MNDRILTRISSKQQVKYVLIHTGFVEIRFNFFTAPQKNVISGELSPLLQEALTVIDRGLKKTKNRPEIFHLICCYMPLTGLCYICDSYSLSHRLLCQFFRLGFDFSNWFRDHTKFYHDSVRGSWTDGN